jgi:acetyl esterase/lipase
MIYLHGGGWVEGNRSDFGATAAFYAKRGIAGFTIDYTLATQNTSAWPTNIQDVLAAVHFIRENAQNFNIDPTRIAAMGSSAGAQLASLLGTLSGKEAFLTNATVDKVQLVINYASVTDLEFVGQNRTENNNLIYSIISSLFGNISYEQNPDLWKEASPASYISADDATFVFIHGIYDRIVPIEIAESFNTKLQNASVETFFVKIQGDHDILTNEDWNLQARYTIDPALKNVFDLN